MRTIPMPEWAFWMAIIPAALFYFSLFLVGVCSLISWIYQKRINRQTLAERNCPYEIEPDIERHEHN